MSEPHRCTYVSNFLTAGLSTKCSCGWEASELDHAHELLTDAGIPRVDDNGEAVGLAVRVGLLIDESNSVHAELDGLLKSLVL